MGVVDDAIDDGGVVPAQGDDDLAARQFAGPQMDLAAGADLHRRRPHEPKRGHVVLEQLAPCVDAIGGGLHTGFLPLLGFGHRRHDVGERGVDFLIRTPADDGDRAGDTVARCTLEASRSATAVVDDDPHDTNPDLARPSASARRWA